MKKPLLTALALILIFEEWLWDILTLLNRKLTEKLGLDRFDRWLTQISPGTALLTLGLPVVLLFPVHIEILRLMAQGQFAQALGLEVIVKLISTLLIARIFTTARAQLMTFRLIAWVYNTVMRWLRWAHDRIVDTAVYRIAQRLKVCARAQLQRWRALKQ
jgi:hypothetical protein